MIHHLMSPLQLRAGVIESPMYISDELQTMEEISTLQVYIGIIILCVI